MPTYGAGAEGEEMTKTPGGVQPPKQLSKAERDARKVFRQVDAQKAMQKRRRITRKPLKNGWRKKLSSAE